MGKVYRARDPILDRLVALKTVSPELLAKHDTMARFQREARAAARLQHPNIVTIFELGEVQGSLFIAMELLEGMDLAEAMHPRGRLRLEDKVRIVVDVCRGLDYAHKRGVVHRDVKPANIRILSDGTVKLVDFGIAHLTDSTMTQTGLVLGTPSYMAPEILAGGRVDHRADMWAVGVVLYELLAGARPYDAPTIAGLIYRIVHQPPAPFDPALGLPAGLPEAVSRALAKDPSARFKDCAELAQQLQAVMGMAWQTDTPLHPAARQQALERNLEEGRRLLAGGDPEGALEAARRAQALEPSRTSVLELLQQIEERLADTPTVLAPRARPVTEFLPLEPLPAETTEAPPSKPLPTPVLTELRIRGASAFRELATFGEPPATSTCLRSPAGDVLATSGSDGAIRLWDLRSRIRVQTLRTEMHRRTGHDALATSLAFSPDGALLASGHVDGQVHLWHMASGAEYPARLRHDALVGALAFSPDGRALASGGMDSKLQLWDVLRVCNGEAKRDLHRQPSGVTAVSYVKGGALIVTGHANRILRVLDARSGRLAATLRGPEALINLVCLAPDGQRLAVASHDRTIRVFDLERREQLLVLPGHRKPATSVAFFGDGLHLASVALDNSVQLWDLEARAALAALWGPAAESFAGVTLFGEGDHIAVALADGRIRIWGPAS
jgi:eukaryotic-like serine/threonine-protein kinase